MQKYMIKRIAALQLAGVLGLCGVSAQESWEASASQHNDGVYQTTVTGSIQSDMLLPQGNQEDGSHEDFRTNTYLDLHVMSKFVDAGGRLSYLEHPLPGYEKDFKGWGISHFYVKAKLQNVELTLGNYYEQFGSGFILRTYEDRSLGIDNALLGGRLLLKPFKGVQMKALTGVQRRYWDYNKAWLVGADLQVNLEEYIPQWQQSGHYVMLAGSWLNKHESAESDGFVFADPTHRYRFPDNVNSWDVRAQWQHGGMSLLTEYAQKSQDPSFDNGYIYRKGYTAMLSAGYSQRGMSALAQVKRSDNMSSRSRRQMIGTSSFVNHLPAFTFDHTYSLAAHYPYATQLAEGEWAYQGQLAYNFKRRTALGGRYGTSVQVNFSHVHAIDKHPNAVNGYGSAFWKWGRQTYYQDLNVQIDKKITPTWKLHFMYMNQFYNKTVVEGEGGMIHSDILVAESKWQLSPKTILRSEMQYLHTKDDEKDWLFALLELSVAPHWMFTASDEYNAGVTKRHYWNLYATYTAGAHRLQFGYVRTRRGYNCSGGVCRLVPSYQGLTLSYNYNF